MFDRIFCNVENGPFDAAKFTAGPDSTTIHVVTEGTGHTLDGRQATKAAHEQAWKLEPQIIEPIPAR